MESKNIFVEQTAYVWYSLYIMAEKRYYMSDILKVLEISKNTYLNWEKLGKVPKSKRDPMSNYRYWFSEDVKKLKTVTGREKKEAV
ncbi:MAG: hypothetical protein KAJ70_00645 [Candidatus Omnitrophica bacterium]|nr:hypothetical protein [Candidatus Omnitrophota bacterium]